MPRDNAKKLASVKWLCPVKTAIMAFPDEMIADPFAVSSWAMQIWGVGGRHLTPFTLRLCLRVFQSLTFHCVGAWVCAQSCPTLCDPMDCGLPGSSLFVGFFKQEYWNGLPFPPPGDLPNPGIKAVSPLSLALAGEFFTTEPPGKPLPSTANVNSAQHWDFCFWLLCALPGLQYSFCSQPR